MCPPRPAEDGFTLVELIVALALFGLIALAGVGLIDGVLGVREGTEGRLERLGEYSRAMFVLDSDLSQLAPGPLAGDATTINFRRQGVSAEGRGVPVTLRLTDGTLIRTMNGASQTLLPAVSSLSFRYLDGNSGWLDRWPPTPSPEDAGRWPLAVEAQFVASPVGRSPGGLLRRVVALPARP